MKRKDSRITKVESFASQFVLCSAQLRQSVCVCVCVCIGWIGVWVCVCIQRKWSLCFQGRKKREAVFVCYSIGVSQSSVGFFVFGF